MMVRIIMMVDGGKDYHNDGKDYHDDEDPTVLFISALL